MPYIEKEELDQLKQIDVLTYLQRVHPSELVKIGHNVYCTRAHDSLKISNGKWMWWSQGVGGKNALDYLVTVEGKRFYEAATYLKEIFGIRYYRPARAAPAVNKKYDKAKADFRLPEKADNNSVLIKYLQKRGISKQVIDYFINHNYIYQSKPADNIVFVGFNSADEPKYASVRGTGDQRFYLEPSGSNKKYSFRITNPDNTELHIFEGAIDLLSYATLLCRSGKDFTKLNLLSLGGVTKDMTELPESVSSFITEYPIKTVFLHLDNDEAGIKASQKFTDLLSGKVHVINSPPQTGKDVNDELLKHIQRERNIDR